MVLCEFGNFLEEDFFDEEKACRFDFCMDEQRKLLSKPMLPSLVFFVSSKLKKLINDCCFFGACCRCFFLSLTILLLGAAAAVDNVVTVIVDSVILYVTLIRLVSCVCIGTNKNLSSDDTKTDKISFKLVLNG